MFVFRIWGKPDRPVKPPGLGTADSLPVRHQRQKVGPGRGGLGGTCSALISR